MASNEVIYKKMRAANIPPTTFGTTLVEQGHNILRGIIADRDFKREDGRLNSYVIHADDETESGMLRSFAAASLFAKELVLINQPVYLLSTVSLAFELRHYDYTMDDEDRLNPIFSKRGHGYIVVPEFDRYEVIENASNQRECMDWLAQHVQRGGGLILGCPKYRPVDPNAHRTFATVASQFLLQKI